MLQRNALARERSVTKELKNKIRGLTESLTEKSTIITGMEAALKGADKSKAVELSEKIVELEKENELLNDEKKELFIKQQELIEANVKDVDKLHKELDETKAKLENLKVNIRSDKASSTTGSKKPNRK